MILGHTAKLDLIQLIMGGFLRIYGWKVVWVKAGMK